MAAFREIYRILRLNGGRMNLKRWKRSVSYGYRWMAETVFSSIKRTFGEHVTARKFPHIVKEIFLKAALLSNELANCLHRLKPLMNHAT